MNIVATPNDKSIKSGSSVPCLDGIRGLAALWVLLFHIQALSGTPWLPILSSGGLAVDLFMIMSGYLMVFTVVQRCGFEPLDSRQTWISFWIRRFFRIAPLYYVCLAIAMIFGGIFGDYRHEMYSVWPDKFGADAAARYADTGLRNVISHVLFVFGLFPQTAGRTVLPDWSIGLEMQFYAVFPFLMLLFRRFQPLVVAIAAVLVSAVSAGIFHNYFAAFSMPALLPMKLYMFLCGMLIAATPGGASLRQPLIFCVATAFGYLAFERHLTGFLRIPMIIGVFYVLGDNTLPGFAKIESVCIKIRKLLGGRIGHFLGEMSYSVYLLHMLVLLPVLAFGARTPAFVALPSLARFGIACAVIVPMVYALAVVFHYVIEKPGIDLGKAAVRKLMAKKVDVEQANSVV